MANLLIDFTKGFASSVAPDSLSELKSDADTIKDSIMGGARTAQDKYREIRQSSGFKKVTDFFFRRSSDFESGSTLEDNDDDFDAGFNFDSSGDSNKKQETSLDYEGMRNIVKGQVSSMYQIAGKQAEASAMTTSEIISTLNTRTSEILSSLGNVNTTLKEISGKLDKMIQLQSGSEDKQKNKRFSLMDSSGNISLSGLFDAAKSGIMENEYVSMAMMVPTLFSTFKMMGSMSDSKSESIGSLAGMAATMFGDHIKFGSGNNKRSLNEMREAVDARVHDTVNSVFTKIMNSNIFKKIFGNFTKRDADKDYSNYVSNNYDRKQAIFDNMTRKTIVDIIPSYLRKITAALTGQNFFISSDGSLTTDKPNGFTDVFNSTLASGFNSRRIGQMMNHASENVDKNDVDMAQRVLTSLYVFQALREGIAINDGDDFANGGDPSINARAVELLSSSGHHKSASYWENVITLITGQLIADKRSRDQFAKVIRSTAASTDKRAINYAENATSILDIGRVTKEIEEEVIKGYVDRTSGTDDRTYDERIKAGEMKESDIPVGASRNDRPSDRALEEARRERIRQSELVGNIGKSFQEISSTTIDYVASIFHLLNRGINVYSMNADQQTPFPKMKLIKASEPTSAPNVTSPSATPTGGGENKETPTQTTTPASTADPKQTPETNQKEPDMFDKTVNAAKNLVKNPFEAAKGFVNKEIEAMKGDYENVKNEASIRYNKEMAMGQLRNDDTISDQDKAIADSVLAAMQAGVQDGETSEDLPQLMEQISKIENEKLKSRLTTVVQGTMKRSEVKKPAQSKIGKVLLWGFGLAKKFIGGILTKAKTFITTIGKKFLAPLFKSLGKNVQGIKRGAVAIKEGFFGSEESEGIFGRIKGKFSSNKGENGGEEQPSQVQPANTTAETPQQKQQRQDTIDLKKDIKELKENTKSFLQLKMDDVKDKINNNSAVQWFKNTEFGQGFMSAFQKPKELKEETVADKATKSIDEILNDKKGVGVFGTIIDSITGVTKKVQEGIDRLQNPIGESSQSGDGVSISVGGGSSTDTSTPTEGGSDTGAGAQAEVNVPTPSVGTGGAGTGGATTGASGAAVAAGGGKKGLGFDLGKIMGGMFSIGGNLIAMIVKVITSLKAFKAMMSMFNKALTKILKPLNKAFQALTKALKPVIQTVTKVLKQIVEYVVQIVQSVIEIMQPILEAIGPLIEQIFKILEPILKIITDVVDVILASFMGVLNSVLVPVIKTIASTLEIVSGIIEVGFGLVLTVLGGVYTVVGGILKFLTLGFADSQYKMGKQMMDTGTKLVQDGGTKLKEGLSSLANSFTTVGSEVEDDLTSLKGKTPKREMIPTGSPMDGVYGSGDFSLDSVYGGYGVNQGRYGNFMNMTQRGCGPVALADAYARRSGSAISATGLTSAMASSGTYSPSMGTSVSGFMNTAGAMGMNLTAGGVTPASLKQASPSNPITIIGSGSDFSTRNGNNHYMNVIGSSGSTAFVSNPLSGRIERRPISGLASSSVVGLYGSGNAPGLSGSGLNYVYGSGDMSEAFGEAIQDTLSSLKELVGGIVSMFTGDSDTEAAVKKANQEKEYEMAMQNQGLSGLEEAEAKFKSKVFAPGENGKSLIELAVPRWSNESDGDYQKRLEKTYQKNKIKYLTLAMNADLQAKAKLAAGDGEGTLGSILKNSVGDDFAKAMDDMYQNVSNAGTLEDLFKKYSAGYAGDDWEYKSGFYSDTGSPLYIDQYTPSVFNNNDAVNWSYPDGNVAPNIPLMEWFRHNVPGVKGISGAFAKYGGPANKNMEGSTGDVHTGADFFADKGTRLISPVYGTIVANFDESTGGTMGNAIVVRDWGNAFHLFSHLDSPSSLPVGTDIWGGDELGYIGNTGSTKKTPHLHWQIQESEDGSGAVYNPFTFFNWYELEKATSGDGSLSASPEGPSDEGNKPKGFQNFTDWMKRDNFTQHKSEFEGSKFHDMAVAAGLTPQQEAYVAAVALQVDGGKRLFGGDVSLVQNGKFGLANWGSLSPNGGHDQSYGSTIQDQLRLGFMRNYFQSSPASTRAYISNVDRYRKALATAMGYDPKKGEGTQWGTYLNTDLLEGTGHGIGTAVLSDWGYTYDQQVPLYGAYLGDAARYYNWLIEKGYVTDDGGSKTSLGATVDNSGVTLDSALLDPDKRILTQELIDQWNANYDRYYAETGIYYDESGNLIGDWSDDGTFVTAAESAARNGTNDGVPYLFSLYADPTPPSNLTGYARDAWMKANAGANVGNIGVARNKSSEKLYDYIVLDELLYNKGVTYDSAVKDRLIKSMKKFGLNAPVFGNNLSYSNYKNIPDQAKSSYLTNNHLYADTAHARMGYDFKNYLPISQLKQGMGLGGKNIYFLFDKSKLTADDAAWKYLYGVSIDSKGNASTSNYATKNNSNFAPSRNIEISENNPKGSSSNILDSVVSIPLETYKLFEIARLFTGKNNIKYTNNHQDAIKIINDDLRLRYPQTDFRNSIYAAVNGNDYSVSIIQKTGSTVKTIGVLNLSSDGKQLVEDNAWKSWKSSHIPYATTFTPQQTYNQPSTTTQTNQSNPFDSMSDAEYENFRKAFQTVTSQFGTSGGTLPTNKSDMMAYATAKEMSDSINMNALLGGTPKLGVSNEAYRNLFGSGDMSQIIPFGLNNQIGSQISDLFSQQSLADNGVGPTVINAYKVSRSSDDIMNRLTSNTYNIRSEKIESTLMGMLTLMRERRQKSTQPKKQPVVTRSRNQNRDGIFTDETIPRQIERLSIG